MFARRIRRFLLALGLVVAVSAPTSACQPTCAKVTNGGIVCIPP
jgi:hypothetical protein